MSRNAVRVVPSLNQRRRPRGKRVIVAPAAAAFSLASQKPAMGESNCPGSSVAAQSRGTEAVTPPYCASICETTCSQRCRFSIAALATTGLADNSRHLFRPLLGRVARNDLPGSTAHPLQHFCWSLFHPEHAVAQVIGLFRIEDEPVAVV